MGKNASNGIIISTITLSFLKNICIYIAVFTLLYCDIPRFLNTPSPDDPAQDFLLFLLFQREDSNYEMYYFEPNPTPLLGENREDFLRFKIPSTVSNKKSKSLVFIHGWNFKERSNDPQADFAYKVSQIENTWNSAIGYIDNSVANWRNEYDVYFFTYRTSDRVFDNGRRLLQELRRNFTEEQTIVLVSHSMGGLVSRQAMLNSQGELLIDGLVSLGTPYYGSPFAIPGFVANNVLLEELQNFYTGTDGGKDLIHTNSGTNQPFLDGGVNIYLDELSKPNDFIDNRTIAYYGDMSDCNRGELVLYRTTCLLLKNSSFPNNDSIVTANSATLSGRVKQSFRKENFDHSMTAFQTINSNTGKVYFEEVMEVIRTTNW